MARSTNVSAGLLPGVTGSWLALAICGLVVPDAPWDCPANCRSHVAAARQDLHTGAQFGRVFAWIWDYDPSEAMSFLAEVLIELRDREPGVSINPRVRLDEILKGLRLALPSGFCDYHEAVDRARREFPGYYGGDPNGP
jgi:hypothetical protein